jgi:cytochrome c biogenesis protein CcdA
MGIGIGIVLLVIGLILLFAIKEFPASVQEAVDPATVGWILVVAGVLALVLGLVMNNQRSRTTHVEERRDV